MYVNEQAAINEIKHIAGQHKHEPRIYFLDFSITVALGYTAAYLYFSAYGGTGLQLLWFLVAGFALFRAGLFMHEIVHMPSGTMNAFKVFWNSMYGIPLGIHSYLYTCHLYHHQSKTFGTVDDGEYLPLGQGSKWRLVLYLLEVPIFPILSLVRLTVLVPLSFIFRWVRSWLIENASSAVMNPRFRFRKPKLYDRWWALCDLASSIWIWCIVLLAASGVMDWHLILKAYCLMMLVIGINWLRNLIAHTYTNDGNTMSHLRQFLDSINIGGPSLLAGLFFPVGMRYHALHHLFPDLPYHAMANVHRRLKASLPPESPYLAKKELSVYGALKRLVTRSGGATEWQGVSSQ